MTPPHEQYQNAPVVLVVVEVRHDHVAVPSGPQLSRVRGLLEEDLPLQQPLSKQTLTALIGQQPSRDVEQVPRFSSRDRRTAVTYNAESVVLETTDHRGFGRLLELLGKAITARAQVSELSGVMRIGLRYIDEIRVPDLQDDPLRWSEWVDASLLGPVGCATSLGLNVEQADGSALLRHGPQTLLIVRFGPREGFAVPPGGLLERPAPAPGPFFLLDIDSFWQPTGEVPRFNIEWVLATTEGLHTPVSDLFEALITDKLRTEVLRHD